MKCNMIQFCLAFVCVGLIQTDSFAQTTGKTFGNDVTFVSPPHLRIVSDDSVNGKPEFDYFLLSKVKLSGFYDISGGLQGLESFPVDQIDVWGTDNANRFSMTMRQTQIRLRGQSEIALGTLIGYIEGDFGYNALRLRHAWVDFEFIHFGQDWSFFGDKDIWPNTLDWESPSPGVWNRTTELIFYFPVAGDDRVDIGLGAPTSGYYANTDYTPVFNWSLQKLPDVIAAYKLTAPFGHLRVTAVFRNLSYKADILEKSVRGYGATFSGLIKTSDVLPNSIQFQFIAGAGIARYVSSFANYNYDVLPTGSGEMESATTISGWAAYEHYLSKQWHFNLIGGFTLFRTDTVNRYTIPRTAYIVTDGKISLDMLYGTANLMYDPIPNMVFGLEYNFGFKNASHKGMITTPSGVVSTLEQSRPAHRISFGFFFDF